MVNFLAEKAATKSRRLDGLVTTEVNQPILVGF